MVGTVSTILVMGPPGAGKSAFIELLAGPIKLQLNGAPTDDLRAISVSPYFEDGDTIKLVKFPGFNENGVDPTDAKLFVDLSTFLSSSQRRGELIRAIIYLHPMNHDGLNVADVKRNAKMLEQIVKGIAPSIDPMQNVVIVTSKWDGIENSQRSAREDLLQGDLMQFYSRPRHFIHHGGTKYSALGIVSAALKRKAIPFGLQNDLVTLNKRFINTSAGKELSIRIETLIRNRQAEEHVLQQKIDDAEDEEEENRLKAEKIQLGAILAHLVNERSVLRTTIALDWATSNNNTLESAIQTQRELATKNWKAEYDTLMAKYKQQEGELEKLRAVNGALNKPIRAISSNTGGESWLPHSVGDVLYTNGHPFGSTYGSGYYLARDSAGHVGVAAVVKFETV